MATHALDVARNDAPLQSEPALALGLAGVAVLAAYSASSDQSRMRAAENELRAAASLARRGLDCSLYGGVTGVAWAIAHLGRLDGVPPDHLPLRQVDELLEARLREPWTGDLDLISGLAGIGVYALERLPAAAGRRLLDHVIDRLGDAVELRDGKAAWPTPAMRFRRDDAGEVINPYDAGLAHGMPGMIAFLASAHRQGVEREDARVMLEGAVAWQLELAGPATAEVRFPSFVVPGKPLAPSRTAWCYGDPGVAVALLAAARALGRPDWEDEALATALAAARRPAARARLGDGALCHGAAGVAHILARLHQATGNEELAEAARRWYGRALEMVWDPALPSRLLNGSVGVALALLAASGDADPGWDRMLLTS